MTTSRATARRSSASSPDRRAALAATALAAVVAAGCGFGPGDSESGEATIRITRDYGGELIGESTVADPTESDTVMRVLDSGADIETRYGGGFVQSVDGIAGGTEDGRTLDWFFYVNGIESAVGAADVRVHPGDRIWWDYRDWTEAMRVPAVVGSWPEPFADAPQPVRIECAAARPACDEVAARLGDEGVAAAVQAFGAQGSDDAPRVLVGPWQRLQSDPVAALIEQGPSASGVFAEARRADGEWKLAALDAAGNEVAPIDPGAGLVAALKPGEDPATWLVTGLDAAGVEEASEALTSAALRDSYAIEVEDGDAVPLPAPGVIG